jgi:hypothetical protein
LHLSEEAEMKKVSADRAYFIKLGEEGRWEADCLRDGKLRFGYQDVSHELCHSGQWDSVAVEVAKFSKDKGAATRHVSQIRTFYEADDKALWITFHSDRLWWCFAHRQVTPLKDNEKERHVIDKWSDRSVSGALLILGKLGGKLLAIRRFPGTICSVSELDYLLHKINDEVAPHISTAHRAFEKLRIALIPIIQKLHPNDLEIMVDLIFRQAGWQRVGVSGGTEKDIDLDLISPVTDERIAVQVKARASVETFAKYRTKFSDMRGYSTFYFVTSSPDPAIAKFAASSNDRSFVYWGVEELANHVIRNGLTGWLLDKAS